MAETMHLKQRIIRYLSKIALCMMLTFLVLSIVLQVRSARNYARSNAGDMFYQIGQILSENREELEGLRAGYREDILRRADVIAHILDQDPSAFSDEKELEAVARLAGVDEIHLFDSTGTIVSGTVPEYYGYTVDSGEQIGFFKPMLTDKSLRMVQDIAPNTVEEKHMQYSMIWSLDGTFLVQVGMEPVNVRKVTQKNELSYIFSLLRANPGVRLYAAEPGTGVIQGATEQYAIGKTLEEIGLSEALASGAGRGFDAAVNGIPSFCVFREMDSNLIGYCISNEALYRTVPHSTVNLVIALALIALMLVLGVTRYIDRYVIKSLADTNACLREITGGNLEKSVDIRSSVEFSELSDHINDMVNSLLGSTRKMSEVLDRAEIGLGVYEYSDRMQHVRVTALVPEILSIEADDGGKTVPERDAFRAIIRRLMENPLPDEDKVYALEVEDGEHYIKLDEFTEDAQTTGIVMDMTDAVIRRREIETERDIDPMTGILNRRGLDNALAQLFQRPDRVEHSAVVMVDADGLKGINDTCGHDSGDRYICALASLLNRFGRESAKNFVVCRNGGDEFVLFLYDYEDEASLMESIHALSALQDTEKVKLTDGSEVMLRFSMGYTLRTKEMCYYGDLFKAADASMYQDKRTRRLRQKTADSSAKKE